MMRELLSSATRAWRGFLADQAGATAIEYAMIASCIAAVIAVVVIGTGNNLRTNIYQPILDGYPG
jgi:Flp pilus assembly pilin Flp